MERWRSSALPGGRWLREAPPSTLAAALPPSVLMMRALRGGERVKEGGEERKRGKGQEREREKEKGERERRRKGDNQPLYWRTLLLSIPSPLPSPLPPCTWRVKPALQFSIFCVQSRHRLHHVLLTILNLHCPLRLQYTPSTQTV